MKHSNTPLPYSRIIVFCLAIVVSLLTGAQPLVAATETQLNPTSYINYIEDRISFFENRDGLQSGEYGQQDGNLTVKELCNVGGQLVHTVDGFSKWSYRLYRMQLMTASYYSALVGCASYPLFLLEALEPVQDDMAITPATSQAIEQEKHNLEFLVGRY